MIPRQTTEGVPTSHADELRAAFYKAFPDNPDSRAAKYSSPVTPITPDQPQTAKKDPPPLDLKFDHMMPASVSPHPGADDHERQHHADSFRPADDPCDPDAIDLYRQFGAAGCTRCKQALLKLKERS